MLATLRSVTKGRQGRDTKGLSLGDVETATPRNAKSGKPRRILLPTSRGGSNHTKAHITAGTYRQLGVHAQRVHARTAVRIRRDSSGMLRSVRDSNESKWTSMVHGLGHGETWGLLSNLGGFVTYQDTYPMNLACIVHVSCMYLDVFPVPIHQGSSMTIDIKIHVTMSRSYIRYN